MLHNPVGCSLPGTLWLASRLHADSFSDLPAHLAADFGSVVAAEPDAVRDLVVACGYMPLALRIAAANLVGRPEQAIKDFVDELTAGDRLSQLAIHEDPQTAVRTVMEQSYARLSTLQRRVFRLIGLAVGYDFDVDTVARLCDMSHEDVSRTLNGLTGVHLVIEEPPGRFHMHDLVRLFAAERGHDEELPARRQEAVARLYMLYLTTASAATTFVAPQTARLPRLVVGKTAEFADDADAMSWLKTEIRNLIAAIQHAAQRGHALEAWHRVSNRQPATRSAGAPGEGTFAGTASQLA